MSVIFSAIYAAIAVLFANTAAAVGSAAIASGDLATWKRVTRVSPLECPSSRWRTQALMPSGS